MSLNIEHLLWFIPGFIAIFTTSYLAAPIRSSTNYSFLGHLVLWSCLWAFLSKLFYSDLVSFIKWIDFIDMTEMIKDSGMVPTLIRKQIGLATTLSIFFSVILLLSYCYDIMVLKIKLRLAKHFPKSVKPEGRSYNTFEGISDLYEIIKKVFTVSFDQFLKGKMKLSVILFLYAKTLLILAILSILTLLVYFVIYSSIFLISIPLTPINIARKFSPEKIRSDFFRTKETIQVFLTNGKIYAGTLKGINEDHKLYSSYVLLDVLYSGKRNERDVVEFTKKYTVETLVLINEDKIDSITEFDFHTHEKLVSEGVVIDSTNLTLRNHDRRPIISKPPKRRHKIAKT